MNAATDLPSVPRMVVDASVILAWYLPADRYKDDALALLEQATANLAVLCVPTLARYEVLNVLALSVRGTTPRHRLAREEADDILAAFTGVPMEERAITGLEQRMLEIAITFQRSAYDAAYLALAESLDADFMTGDARLYRAVRRRFRRIRLLGSHG